jgi:ankyrin repeat protein
MVINPNNETLKEPVILIIIVDENENYFLKKNTDESFSVSGSLSKIFKNDPNHIPREIINSLIIQINDINPDFIVGIVYNSLSCTSDHFLHHLMHLIDKTYQGKRASNYKDYKQMIHEYVLSRKADSVKPKDSSLISCSTKISRTSKPSGFRIRIFERYDVKRHTLNEKNKINSVSKNFNSNSNYDELFNNKGLSNSCNKEFCISKIGFKRYSERGILFDVSIKNPNNKTIFRYFFVIWSLRTYMGQEITSEPYKKLFSKPKKNTGNWIDNKTIYVPYVLQIYIIDTDYNIMYIKYDKNQEIDLLKCLRDKERLRSLKYNRHISDKKYRDGKYIIRLLISTDLEDLNIGFIKDYKFKDYIKRIYQYTGSQYMKLNTEEINYTNIISGDTILHYIIKSFRDMKDTFFYLNGFFDMLNNDGYFLLNKKDNNGDTALMVYINIINPNFLNHKYKSLLNKLITTENINLQNNKKETALMLAIRSRSSNSIVDILINIVDILINIPNIDINLKNNNGETALMLAIRRSRYILNILINIPNIDINLQNNNGETALMVYININPNNTYISLLNKLITTENINLKNNNGETALMLAIRISSLSIVDILIKIPDIDINLKNNNGETALMLAIRSMSLSIVDKLIKKPDIDINLQNNNGETALMLAIDSFDRNYNKQYIFEILSNRPNIIFGLKDTNGQTAISLLIKLPHDNYRKLLTKIILKYSLPQFIDFINETIIGVPINEMNIGDVTNPTNIRVVNKKKYNNFVYDIIIEYLKKKYNLQYNSSQVTKKEIKPIKNKALETIVDIFLKTTSTSLFFLEKNDTFLRKIEIVYYDGNTTVRAGINDGGLLRNFFFECQEQLNILFSNKPNNSNQEYYTKLKKSVDWNNYIIVIYLLIFSKINNCPIYLDKKLFLNLSIIILNLIILDTKYSLTQKIIIINILEKYKDIFKKDLHYGMYELLLTQRQKDKMINNESFNIKNAINFITKNNRVDKEKNMSQQIKEIEGNIKKKKSNTKIIIDLIIKSINDRIYQDVPDFFITHFISNIVTFETFMKNINFRVSISSVGPITNKDKFINDIKKLLNYMNEKDKNNILLLAQGMSSNTLLANEYIFNLYSGDNGLLSLHSCYSSMDLYEGSFNKFFTITENEEENQKVLEKFMDLIKTSIKSNFFR